MHNGSTDKNRRNINLKDPAIKEVLPEYFGASYPKFIRLLERYYDFEKTNETTELLYHLFSSRDITETDIALLDFIEDELLLGQSYYQGFPDKRAAANFSSILFRTKGSRYSIEWFFRSFYNIDPEIFYTKNDIFKIGTTSSFIGPDSLKFLHDDKLYQTFALLIKTSLPVDKWKDIYKLFVHPAGMYLGSSVLLESTANSETAEDATGADIEFYNSPVYTVSSGTTTPEGNTYTVLIQQTQLTPPAPPSYTNLFYYVELLTAEVGDFTTPPNLDSNNLTPIVLRQNTASFDFTFVDDNDYAEGDEVFNVHIYDGPSITRNRLIGTSVLTIGNILPVYTVVLDSYAETEDMSGTVVVTGTISTAHPNGFTPAFIGEAVTLSFTGGIASDSRVSNLQFTDADAGSNSGSMNTVSKTFSFDIAGDRQLQGVVTGNVRVNGVVVGNSTTFTLSDAAPVYELVVSDTTVTEQSGATITYDLGANTSNIADGTYYFWTTGTGTAEVEFNGGASPLTGSRLAFTVTNQQISNVTGIGASVNIPIDILDDTIPDGDKTLQGNFHTANTGAATTQSGVTTITDNEVVPDFDTVTLFSDAGRTVASTSFNEGDTIYGRLVTSGSAQGETITYQFVNGDARTTDTDTSVHATSGNQDFTLVLGSDISTINGSPAGLIVRCSSSGTYANNLDTGTITIVDETISYTAAAVSSSVTEGSLLQVEYTATLAGGASYENLIIAVADNGDSRVTAGNYAITSTQFGLADPGATGVSTVTLSIASTADPAVNGDGTIEFVGTGAVYGQGSVPAQVDITVTDATPSYGAFSVSPTSIDEDGTVAEFELLASNVGVGVTVDWISNATGGVEYIGPDLQISYTSAVAGFANLTQNFGTITRAGDGNFRFWVRAIADLAVDNENPEDFIVTIAANDSNATATGGPSATLEVNDTSIPLTPTYAIQGSNPLTVSEVASAQTITVNTTNVTDGTTLYWNITTDAPGSTQASTDWAAYNSGGTGFTINSNTGSFSIDALADTTTETAETYYLQVRTGSDTGSIQDSIQLDITDDSVTANAPTVTPSTTTPTEGDTVTFTFGEAAGSAAQTYYFEIKHGTTSNADFTAVPPGNTPTARTTVTWNGTSFSPTSVAVTLAGAGGADGVDDNEQFTGKLFDAVTGGTEVATTANITVTDDPVVINFAFATTSTDINLDGASGGGQVFTEVTLFNNGDATVANSFADFFSTGTVVTNSVTPTIASDNWVEASEHVAGFGDDYQIQVNCYTDNTKTTRLPGNNTRSNDFPNSPANNGSYDTIFLFKGTTNLNGNEAGVTNVQWEQDDTNPAWFQMDEDIKIQLKCDVAGFAGSGYGLSGLGTATPIYIEFIIKEYAGVLGTGTTVLTAGFEAAIRIDNSSTQ